MRVDRRQVLGMLAAGQMTAEEADRLITALDRLDRPTAALARTPPRQTPPRYLRVLVDVHEDGSAPINVNVRVPLQILRAGVRLASLIPPQAQEQVNRALRQRGVPFDVMHVRPENLDQFIDRLSNLSLAVDQREHDLRIKLYCE